MAFYDKEEKQTGKWIVYSYYGWQSHIVMNQYGAIFSCNPKTVPTPRVLGSVDCVVYDSEEEANQHMDKFYDRKTQVQFIAKFEKDFVTQVNP